MNSCCFTGYRPAKFPFPLYDGQQAYETLKADLLSALLDLQAAGCKTLYSGAAMGFDLLAAELALDLRDHYKAAALQVICVIPFPEQAAKYPADWRKRYETVLARSDSVVLISDQYHQGCYQQRNRWMVDHSDAVLTWFDGQSGGTKNTLDYAAKQCKRVINLRDDSVQDAMFSLFEQLT